MSENWDLFGNVAVTYDGALALISAVRGEFCNMALISKSLNSVSLQQIQYEKVNIAKNCVQQSCRSVWQALP